MSYEAYGYGLIRAARLARALREPVITAAEFGVAGGNGLLALERHAKAAGLPVHVAGFDTGKGMPEPEDYRDLPYVWRGGFYAMDEAALRERTSAELVLGDAGETLPAWLAAGHPPVGFAAFDMDYYSSTARVLAAVAAAPAECFLPRVWCYFDDVVGGEDEIHSEFTGELLAISEFNDACLRRKVARVNGLAWKVGPAGRWAAGIFVLHLFDHPRYCDLIPGIAQQLPLS